jgi:glycerophosphoryl diester phosphodiesterase
MLKENFIAVALDEESNAKVNPIDNNKTVISDQFTSDVEVDYPDLLEGAKTLQDVFDHFNPKIDVLFETEDGGSEPETLQFKSMRDFEANEGKGNLVTNSSFLRKIKMNLDTNIKIKNQIEQNGKLREILKNKQSKEELKLFLESLLNDLKND